MLFIDIVDGYVRVSSLDPEINSEDTMDSNCFLIRIPKGTSDQAVSGVVRNVLFNGGAATTMR